MTEEKQLSFCQHKHNHIKMCAYCTNKADWQFRCYIRPSRTRHGSLGFSIFICEQCSKTFINLMNNYNIKRDWTVKISMSDYKITSKIDFE